MNAPGKQLSIIDTFAASRHMEREALLAVIFHSIAPDGATIEDVIGFLQICHRFNLDPWAKEAYLIKSKGRVSVYISVDGYATIVNREPQYDGCDFTYDQDSEGKIVSVTCSMFRKDRSRPTVVTEFLDECIVPDSQAWRRSPGRMLRHRSFVQAARLAFGISGALDEGTDLSPPPIEAGNVTPAEERPRPTPKRKPPSPGQVQPKGGQDADEKPQPQQQQRPDEVAQFDLDGLLDALANAGTVEDLKQIYSDYDADGNLQDDAAALDRAQTAFVKHMKRLAG